MFDLTGDMLIGGVLHMEDADSTRKGDVSICRMEDDSDVFPHIVDEDILLHMEDAVSRVGDDRGVFPRMGDEDEFLHMEDAASRVVCRSIRKEDETDGCLNCLDSRCKEDNKGEDPL